MPRVVGERPPLATAARRYRNVVRHLTQVAERDPDRMAEIYRERQATLEFEHRIPERARPETTRGFHPVRAVGMPTRMGSRPKSPAA